MTARWLCLALCAIAQAQQSVDAWLEAEARRHWQAREERIAKLATAAEIEAYGREVRGKLLAGIGGLPETKTPLNARTTGGFTREGYRVEHVIFESQPGFRVTANLYVPTRGRAPFPAVLGVAGHSSNGKASALYQTAWISFVRRGYAVLAFDPPGQGERLEYYDPDTGLSRAGTGVPEHIMAGLQCLLAGSTFARHEIWDGIRAFDYLATRPEVDTKRVAVAGNSGGGTQAAYLAAFEPRLAAAVSSCYMTRWRELWVKPGPQDSEQVFTGFTRDGLDFGDFIAAAAPRPFLITSAVRDYFPIAGARATHAEAVRLYERLGMSERAGFFDYDDTHGWSRPRREAAARWLDKFLKGETTDGGEQPVEIEPDHLLNVTPTGQLATSGGSKTVHDINLEFAEKVVATRRALKASDAELRALVARRLNITRPAASTPQPRQGKPALLFAGRKTPDLADFERAGYVVSTVDLRGASLSGTSLSDGSPPYQFAARTWLLGLSVPALQTADVLDALDALSARSDIDPGRIVLWGRGAAGPAVLLAAALDSRPRDVIIDRAIVSYMACVRARVHEGLAPQVIPGVLADFDLPDIARLIGRGRLRIVDPVTPAGGRAEMKRAAAEWPTTPIVERREGVPLKQDLGAWLP